MKSYLKHIIYISLLIPLSSCSSPSSLHELMESYENPGIKIKTGSPFSGSILVAKNDSIIFMNGYGKANIELNLDNTVDTKFGIGSITKQFTAMLIMQQVEQKTIQLTDTIGKYLPYLPKEFRRKITIHHLLSNTSGLPHYFGLESAGLRLSTFGNTTYSPKELAQEIGKTNLIDEPGHSYYYSSLGFHLLGVILEEVTGQSYSDLLKTSITEPLGLKSTGFETNEYQSKELAKGYVYREVYGFDWWTADHGGTLIPAPFRDQSTAYSAGGMHSTVKDLFTWSMAVKSNQILSKELTDIMLTPNKQGYCYGWQRNWHDIIEQNTAVQLYGHGGALSGNSAFIALYDDETTIIYLGNRNNLKAEEILYQVHLLANNLEGSFRLKGYPNRSSHNSFIEAGGMPVMNDYFNRLSTLVGYKVNPSKYTMRGLITIHYEAGKIAKADSLRDAFLNEHNPDESTINQLAYYFLESDLDDVALHFFKTNTEKFPFSSNTWDGLGEIYLKMGNYKLSFESYQKAVEIGTKTNHRFLESYKENLEAVKQKL